MIVKRVSRVLLLVLSLALLQIPGAGTSYAIEGTPIGTPAAPYVVSAVVPDTSTTNAVISWTETRTALVDVLGYTATAKIGGVVAGSCSVTPTPGATSSTVETCTITGLSFAKTYVATVSASNNLGNTPSVNSVTFQTPHLDQTITITSKPSESLTYGYPDFRMAAIAVSGLPVAWSIAPSSSAICSVDPVLGVVHIIKAGTCTVWADQDGVGSSYGAAPRVATTFTIALNLTTGSDTSTVVLYDATNVQGTTATLNGLILYPGETTTPSFCVSLTNSLPCSIVGTGISIASVAPASITSSSSNAVSASVTGLENSKTYYVWLTATAASGTSVTTSSKNFLTLAGPTIATTDSLHGTVGTAMTVTFTASGGSGEYAVWDKGTLPAGLSTTLNPTTIVVSGTPTAAGTTPSFVAVTDTLGQASKYEFNYVISDPSTPPPPAPPGPGAPPSPAPTPVVDTSTVHITLNEPTNVQSTTAELNANAKWLGIDGTPQFCISTVNDNSSCVVQTGVTMLSVTPALITSTVNGAISTKVSGLKAQTTYYVWATITGGGKSEVTPTRVIHTATGPTLSYVGETRIRVGDNLRLVITATSGVAPYKNWKISELPTGLIPLVSGDTAKISGRAGAVAAFDIQVTVEDANKDQGLLTIPIEFYDEASTLNPVAGTTSQVVAARLTQINWDLDPQYTRYFVYLKDHLVCDTQASSCTIKKLLGPKAQITIVGKTSKGSLTPPARTMYLPPVKPIEIALVHFGFNSATLSASDKKLLKTLGKQMRGQGFTSLMIVGHTDAIGSAEFNAVLSGKRATSAVDYLTKLLKKDPVSVVIKKYGFKLPVGDNATPAGRQANRRASIQLR